jgi:hypothetical protein
MSATIMRFAAQWGGVIPRLRDRVGSTHADVKMGVGLNFNRLDDTTSVSQTYGSSRLSWLAWLTGIEGPGAGDAPPIDANALRALISQQLDFVSGTVPGVAADRCLGGAVGKFGGRSNTRQAAFTCCCALLFKPFEI